MSEPVQPLRGTFNAAAMSRGEPGLPARFDWRGQRYAVASVLRSWKTSVREGGVGELYLRRHWHEVLTDQGLRMTLYCERQPKPGKTARQRWWVYSVAPSTAGQAGA